MMQINNTAIKIVYCTCFEICCKYNVKTLSYLGAPGDMVPKHYKFFFKKINP